MVHAGFKLHRANLHRYQAAKKPQLSRMKSYADFKKLELELIQTQMAQKPMLRAEVYAHAMRASQYRKKEV